MAGEVHIADDPRGGWIAIHISASGDSSGCDGPFTSYAGAVEAATDMAKRYDAKLLNRAGQIIHQEGEDLF